METLMVMDTQLQGRPVAFLVTRREGTAEFSKLLRAFKGTVMAAKPDWSLSCFIVDDNAAFITAVR
jgi:hypothetical protein